MNLNTKRHKALELLSSSRIKLDTGDESNWKLGVSFDQLCNKLKCDRDELEIILSELYFNKDIEYTNTDVEGVFSTQQGLTTFSNKKYIKQNNKTIVNWLKNFNQILIPILSLIIAIIALTFKFNTIKKEIENNLSDKYIFQIEALQKQINSIKNSESFKTHTVPKDTIN